MHQIPDPNVVFPNAYHLLPQKRSHGAKHFHRRLYLL